MKFADFLERPGGEVVVGFALIGMGAALWWVKVPKAEDVIVAGLTLVGRAMVSGRAKV
ncbi:MAG TPA: hypothetical protein VGH38_10160 [Bryobacteraceae bacterium]|jgi:hypothetical protein